MTDTAKVEAMRAAFEAWHSSQDQAEPETERVYEFSEDGMNELIKEVMFEAWQAATAQATAGMKDRLLAALERAAAAETSLREEVEQERERCAKLCEKRSSRRRIIYAGANQNPIAPCEFAEAIRRGSL